MMALSFLLGTVPFCFNLTEEKEKKKINYDQIINLIEINSA